MPIVDKIKINGTSYNVVDNNSGYTSFEYSPSVTEGVTVGLMTFNGVTYTIYAPQTTQTGTLDISVEDTNLIFYHDETAVPTTVFEEEVVFDRVGPASSGEGNGISSLIEGKTYEVFIDNVSIDTVISTLYNDDIEIGIYDIGGQTNNYLLIDYNESYSPNYLLQAPTSWDGQTKLIKIVQLD